MTVVSPGIFVSEIRKLRFPNTFNPYADQCEVHDKPEAPELRARMLLEILSMASGVDIDAIWVGRDLGHRGGRRTGLALTDDLRFTDHIRRWKVEIERPTLGPLVRERTAGVIWEMLEQISEVVFLWNIFPLHPFPAGNTFKNRPHSAVERKAGEALLLMLLGLLRPRRIVAVGNDAAKVLGSIARDIEVCHVRHPSYGGENAFRAQVAALYRISNS